jgi:MerR family transcriptional regulator, light-induced transcriptional regulator
MTRPTSDASSRFKIGAVARLAGVSVHTIRKWEERYGAVAPERTDGGGRVYSREDMERLVLIKKLADAGHSLRDLALMPHDALMTAWRQVPGADIPAVDERQAVRVAVLGSVAAATLARFSDELGELDLIASASELSALQMALAGRQVDLLLFETSMLSTHTDAQVRAAIELLGCDYAIVLYHFASQVDVVKVRSPWVSTLKMPADVGSIDRAVASVTRRRGSTANTGIERVTPDVRPPRISPEALARFVSSAPAIECECPNHLVDLVTALRAFEAYSAQCSHKSEHDAALHEYLWRCAARSRALFEDAVEYVAVAEGLELG